MNYQRQYELLIEKARQRGKVEGYKERHHIVPRCMGGSNKKENLVELTAREHYVAHRLLYMWHKTPQMAYAWFSMTRTGNNQERYISNNHYKKAKLAMSLAARDRLIVDNPMNNPVSREKVTTHLRSEEQRKQIQSGVTEETNRKRSSSVKLWVSSPQGKLHHKTRANKLKGVPRTPEVKTKCSLAQKGKPKPKVQCTVCGKLVDKANLARYHKHN